MKNQNPKKNDQPLENIALLRTESSSTLLQTWDVKDLWSKQN